MDRFVDEEVETTHTATRPLSQQQVEAKIAGLPKNFTEVLKPHNSKAVDERAKGEGFPENGQ